MPKLCRLTIKMTIFGVYQLKNKLGHSETLVDPIDNKYTGRKITIHSISSIEKATHKQFPIERQHRIVERNMIWV